MRGKYSNGSVVRYSFVRGLLIPERREQAKKEETNVSNEPDQSANRGRSASRGWSRVRLYGRRVCCVMLEIKSACPMPEALQELRNQIRSDLGISGMNLGL
jgi:hypothetical protein